MTVTEKGFTGAFVTLLSYVIGEFTILTAVMIMIMFADLGTGQLKVWYKKEVFDGEKAFWGVIKKFLYVFLWFLSVLMQLVLKELGPIVGITIAAPVIVLTVTAWIIGTEFASNLDNLKKMGVKTPKILGKAAKSLQEIDDKKEVE